MPVSVLHREVAGVALRAAARYGFALGGGNALIAHGVIDRPTEDVDLFTDREHGVAAAADAVEAALRQAGYTAGRQDKIAGLAEEFEGMGDGLAEWIITTPDGAQLLLQMAYFDRGRQPVLMEFGPVLDLDDALGGKVAALVSRAAERDYLDVAAALARGYTVAQLTALALTLDPGLTAEDFADAGQRLDHLADDRFTPYGLTPDDITRLRKQFAAWPRTPGVVPGAAARRLARGRLGSSNSLHQLRHSTLTHHAEKGTGTPMATGRSGHTSVRSLARYARARPTSRRIPRAP